MKVERTIAVVSRIASSIALAVALLSAPLWFAPPAHAQTPQQMVTIAGVTQGAPTGNFGATEITTPVLASTAKLSQPLGVAVDARGNVYFADSLQDAIQEVSCGNLYPYAQLTTRTTAVTVDKFGNIFYGDANGNIYKNLGELFPVNTLGTGTTGYYVVPQLLTTIAQSVIAMTTDSTGNLFVLSDNQGGNRPAQYTITKIGPENVNPSVTTVSNTFITEATFENLQTATGLVADAAGNLYTYAYDPTGKTPNQILQITQAGVVTPFGGVTFSGGLMFGAGMALQQNSAADASAGAPGTFYMAFGDIYAFTPNPVGAATFTQIAGGTAGGFNGDGNAIGADVNEVNGLAVDSLGAVYIGDSDNNLVRRVANSGYVSPTCGGASGVKQTDAFPNIGQGWVNPTEQKLYLGVFRSLIGDVVVFDSSANDSVLANVPLPSIPEWMAIDPINNFVYTANADGSVSVIDSTTDTLFSTLVTDSKGLASIAIDPVEKVVYAVGTEDSKIYMFSSAIRGTSAITPATPLAPIGNILPLGSVAVDTNSHKAYVVVDGIAPLGELNYSLAVIDGTKNPPALVTTASYLPNASSTDIAPDAVGVDTNLGVAVVADAEDQQIHIYNPLSGQVTGYGFSFFPNHVSVDSIHDTAYVWDGYGNTSVVDLAASGNTTITSVTISPDFTACGAGGGTVVVDAPVNQAYVAACNSSDDTALSLWDNTAGEILTPQLALGTNDGGLAGSRFTLALNPANGFVYLGEQFGNQTPQTLVINGPTPVTQPSVTVTPSTLAFGKITVGTPSSPQLVTVVNTGTVAINFLQSPAFPYISEPTDPGSIKITNQTCGATLAAGANCSFDVAFAPSKNESIGGAIALFDNAPSTPQVITLSGQGQVPTVPLTITPSTLPTTWQVGVPISTVAFNVNGVPSGASVEVLTQTGTLPPGLILNAYTPPFSLFGTPEQSGSFTFTVTAIDTNGDTGSQTYTVNVAANPVEITLSPSFVSVPAGGTVQFSATVTGTTNTGVNWSVSPFPTGGTISTTGLYQAPATAITGTIFVTATSQASSGITAFASVTVTAATTKSTPTITWPAPTAISYGTALSATQLDATASVPGTFSYSPSSGTILNGGTSTLSVTFTPTNTTSYNTATASVLLLVNPVAPTITWPTPAAITYGTALGSTQLDATASVPGSFAYSPASGTTPTAGSTTLNATFTPTNTANYKSATATVSLVVNQATPVITWPTPAAITVGSSLSATQLDATATVPGTFTYSPALGTVLATQGTQSLSVTFTPTDTVDYKSATASVSITVNPPAGVVLTVTETNATTDGSGNYIFTLTVTNSGGSTATAVQITSASLSAKVGSALTKTSTTTGVPIILGALASGASTSVNVSFPASSGTAASAGALQVGFGYGGSNASSSTLRVTLP
ncbi:MAG: choice-of-anchor D domain-containing protein [Candidatus Acidiferrales bacterium]